MPQQRGGRGRSQGRGGGRGGGRGNQGPRYGSKAPPTSTAQHKLLQFAPIAQGKPTATYATVKEAIVQHIQKNFKDGQDVAESIEKGVLYDLSSVEPT